MFLLPLLQLEETIVDLMKDCISKSGMSGRRLVECFIAEARISVVQFKLLKVNIPIIGFFNFLAKRSPTRTKEGVNQDKTLIKILDL